MTKLEQAIKELVENDKKMLRKIEELMKLIGKKKDLRYIA